MEAAKPPPSPPTTSQRQHRKLGLALIVIASIITFLAVFSIWANRQLLETDNWVETSGELLEDEEIRTQLSNFMVDTIYANVDVQGELAQTLPPRLQPLAGPAAGALRTLLDRLANEALQRPRVQEAWESINRTASEKLITVVEEDSDEPVTIDLGTIVEGVGAQAGLNIADKLPPDAGQIEIIPAEDLSTARKLVDLLEKLAIWLTVLALILFAVAIYLARGWRRQALRAVGFAFIAVGIAIAAARGFAGNYVVDTLASTDAVKPAVENTYEIGTSLLSDGAGAMVFYGIVIVLGAWLAGPGGVATSVRRALTPLMENRLIGYGALLLLLLVLFWWAPTEGFKRLPISLLIIALFIIGFEFLRRQAVREFPNETWEQGSDRWRDAGRSLLNRDKS
jgi:hypothetical protein